MKNKRVYIDEIRMVELYNTNQYSLKDIASQLDSNSTTIGRRLRALGYDTSVGLKGKTDRNWGTSECVVCYAPFEKTSANQKFCTAQLCQYTKKKDAQKRNNARRVEIRRQNPEILEAEREAKRLDYARNKEQRRLKKKAAPHGLTEQQLVDLYESQLRCCAVCFGYEDIMEMVIDHDHSCCPGPTSCGECVRGLIHSRHNKALGFVRDDIDELYQLIAYLEGRVNE